MKKLLAFGLIALLFAVVQSVVLVNPGPIDDVGICYVMSADQIQPDMNIVADNSIPLYFYDYAIPVYPDVGSYFGINTSTTYQEILWQSSKTTTIDRTNATYNHAIYEGLLRTDAGDSYSQGRAMPRHL